MANTRLCLLWGSECLYNLPANVVVASHYLTESLKKKPQRSQDQVPPFLVMWMLLIYSRTTSISDLGLHATYPQRDKIFWELLYFYTMIFF